MFNYLTFHSGVLSFVYLMMNIFEKTIRFKLNIHLLSSIVVIGGWYITYFIKELKVKGFNLEYTLTGKWLIISDIIFHFIPFLIVFVCLPNIYSTQESVLTILLILLYSIVYNTFKIYNVSTDLQKNEIIYIMLISVMFYMCLTASNYNNFFIN
jgi:hypothetical protein